MLQHHHIVIEEYSSGWPLAFAQLQSVYQSRLGSYVAAVQHVGSTSVEGLPAKPVIDIDLIIEDSALLKPVIAVLQDLGYEHAGDMGITGREAFKRKSSRTPIDGSSRTWPAHHLYVCTANNISLKNHLAFRNYLRSHPAKAKAYGELKKNLAKEYPDDIDAYVAGKTDFITGVLKEMGFVAAELEDITKQNKLVK
ncbi:GrpB family protein [Flavitalea sp. BT771]|uniref:GrpB family protein n=1 Tax=Flavitalea sp. BT771 TaxID=3063329 RepID=UPI0026E1AD3A|nr:GrpB family protein [Flavitalea sp. BT771]MDO6429106.1 GrpB family protein [Flavitalea sp. BT771]MDV6218766.1 GrpB family protein [Flavitalea sp. BT771]